MYNNTTAAFGRLLCYVNLSKPRLSVCRERIYPFREDFPKLAECINAFPTGITQPPGKKAAA